MARAKLGQHFLKDVGALQKIIGALSLGRGDTLFEVGAGRGALTFPLAALAEEKEFSFSAIEKDPPLAEELKKKLEVNPAAKIIQGDIRDLLPRLSGGEKKSDFKLVGNIPYYLTGYLFRLIAELDRKPTLAVFTLQKEVAERIVALPPKMNKLSAIVRFWGTPAIIGFIPKEAFSPPPEVSSAILQIAALKEKPPISPETYYRSVALLFGQPRKTLLNNIREGLQRSGSDKLSREDITEKLFSLGITSKARPQDLAVENIIRIAKIFEETAVSKKNFGNASKKR